MKIAIALQFSEPESKTRMTEIVRTVGDRPAFITHGNCRIAIAVHDTWYLRERARLRRKSAEAHPDPGFGKGSSLAFRRAWKEYAEWELEQKAWYAPYGLVPPTPSLRSLTASPSIGKQSKAQLVRDYVQVRPQADVNEISTSLQLTKQHVWAELRRARLRGGKLSAIELVKRILADGRLHTKEDFSDISSATLYRVFRRLRQARIPVATTLLRGTTYYQLWLV